MAIEITHNRTDEELSPFGLDREGYQRLLNAGYLRQHGRSPLSINGIPIPPYEIPDPAVDEAGFWQSLAAEKIFRDKAY